MQEHSKRSQSQQVHESPATLPPRRRSRKGGQVTETAYKCDSPPPNRSAPPHNRQDAHCAASYSTDGLEAPQGASQKPPTPSYTANAKDGHGYGGDAKHHGGGVRPPTRTTHAKSHRLEQPHRKPSTSAAQPRCSNRDVSSLTLLVCRARRMLMQATSPSQETLISERDSRSLEPCRSTARDPNHTECTKVQPLRLPAGEAERGGR